MIATALRLFAERGYRATTVGDIEEEAGFTRRGRAFYRHFPSKEAVLAAALEDRLNAATSATAIDDLLPLGDVAAEMRLVARWILRDVRNSRDLIQLLEREDHARDHLQTARGVLMDTGHKQLADLLRRWAGHLSSEPEDPDAIAAVLFGAAVNFERTEWTYGRKPLGLTDERFVEAWVAMARSLLSAAAPRRARR